MKKNKKNQAAVNTIEMTDAPKNAKATIKRLLGLLAQQKAALLAIILATLVSIGLYTVSPLVLGRAIDKLIDGIKEHGFGGGFGFLAETIGHPLIILLGIHLLSSLASFIQEFTMASFGETLVLSLRKKMSKKINKLPLSYYDSHQAGELLSRVTNDLDQVAEVLKTGLLQFTNAIFNITISIILMMCPCRAQKKAARW